MQVKHSSLPQAQGASAILPACSRAEGRVNWRERWLLDVLFKREVISTTHVSSYTRYEADQTPRRCQDNAVPDRSQAAGYRASYRILAETRSLALSDEPRLKNGLPWLKFDQVEASALGFAYETAEEITITQHNKSADQSVLLLCLQASHWEVPKTESRKPCQEVGLHSAHKRGVVLVQLGFEPSQRCERAAPAVDMSFGTSHP